MANTSYSTSNMAGVNVNATFTPSTTTTAYPYADNPPFAVGTQAVGTDGTQWVWVLASAALAQGDVVTISNAYAATGITTTNGLFGNLVGVAPVAVASASYGWMQTKGKVSLLRVKASCLPNVQLATTATAGVIDDAITTGGKKIAGIIITATNTAATAAAKAGTTDFPLVTTTY